MDVDPAQPLHLTVGVGQAAWAELLESQTVLIAVAKELGMSLPELVRRSENATLAEVAFTAGVPREILVASIATALWAALVTGTRAAHLPVPQWLWREAAKEADRKRRKNRPGARREPKYQPRGEDESGHNLDARG